MTVKENLDTIYWEGFITIFVKLVCLAGPIHFLVGYHDVTESFLTNLSNF